MASDRIADFRARMYQRTGLEDLGAHLEGRYGIQVARLSELDLGVFRVDRRDAPTWVARVFPAVRPLGAVERDARVLRGLAQYGYPAERCARPDAVSSLAGQGVLITEFIEGKRADGSGRTFRRLGDLLGRLHKRTMEDGGSLGSGGAWHHLALEGGPGDEIAAAKSLLADALPRSGAADTALYDKLRAELDGADGCDGLPEALLHPDFVPANAITLSSGRLALIDWAGAGRGPRLFAVGFLLWAAGARDLRCVDAVVAGYRAHVALEPLEMARLEGATVARPLIFAAWAFALGRKPLQDVVDQLPATRALAKRIAARAREAAAGEYEGIGARDPA